MWWGIFFLHSKIWGEFWNLIEAWQKKCTNLCTSGWKEQYSVSLSAPSRASTFTKDGKLPRFTCPLTRWQENHRCLLRSQGGQIPEAGGDSTVRLYWWWRERSKAASARSTSCTRRARGCGTGAYYRHPPLLAITSHPRPRSTARTYDARYRARSTCDRIGMKTDRIRTDMADIIFVFVFLLDSDSNTDNINHAG
jgi:hypothetical protein